MISLDENDTKDEEKGCQQLMAKGKEWFDFFNRVVFRKHAESERSIVYGDESCDEAVVQDCVQVFMWNEIFLLSLVQRDHAKYQKSAATAASSFLLHSTGRVFIYYVALVNHGLATCS